LNAQDIRGATPLHYAVENIGLVSRDLNLLSARLLLEAGADPNIHDGTDGLTPLHCSACFNRVDFAILLLSHGADLNAHENPWNETPLHSAAWKYGDDVGKILLDAGAYIDALDARGQTPLHYAVRKCRVKMVRLLLERGASQSITDSENKRPIDYLELGDSEHAQSGNDIQKIEELFSKHADDEGLNG
jgi:ankyrin repeat protein